MRIALLPGQFGMGGRTSHILELTKEFIKKGHQVYILTPRSRYPDRKETLKRIEKLYDAGAEIIKINFPKKSNNQVVKYFIFLSGLIKLACFLKLKKIDIVHVHNEGMALMASLLRLKFVKTLHSPRKSYRLKLQKATHEIAISRETYAEIKEVYGLDNDEISLILHGTSRRFASPSSEQRKNDLKTSVKLPKNKIIIGIVGYIRPLKGHDIFLKAINELNIKERNRIHIVILGQARNKDDKKWMSTLLQKYEDLKEHITKLYSADPKPFYDVFDIQVSASRSEGFSLVSIEGLLSGCCVVRSNVGGARDQIMNRETGFLFPNEDTSALRDILEELIQNEKLRKDVAKKGKNYALSHFTADLMAEKTLAVYRQVIDQKGK
jgi:glycosyltransferase involved in cell wall biosynthesis